MKRDEAWKGTSTVRVRYAETDRMGVVYHSNYLVWFEVGRTEFCRDLGAPYRMWEAEGVLLPCVEAHCRYKHPARYDDEVSIVTELRALTPHTVTFEYRIEREGRLLAEGWTKHGFCNPEGKLLREPQPFFGMLRDLVGASGRGATLKEQEGGMVGE